VTADDALLIDRAEGIVTLTLNRPARYNALTAGLLAAFHSALDGIAADREARVVRIRGAGPGFCAGDDLEEARSRKEDAAERAFLEESLRLMRRLRDVPKPVIAQVHGAAYASGLELVVASDLVIAAADARFGTPGANIGLWCWTPMTALQRAIPAKKALRMLMTGEPLSAADAERLGLVSDVVPPETLEAAGMALARKLAGLSQPVLAGGKQAFYRGIAAEEAIDALLGYRRLADAREGLTAFLEKRPPRWQDR